jgi:hypothetical protein
MRGIICFAVVMLAGCQTVEYGPSGQKPYARYAYSEQPNGDRRYILAVTGPGNADMATMKAMWERRAQELCGNTDYSRAMYRAERAGYYYGYGGAAPGAPVLQGFLDCTGAPLPAELPPTQPLPAELPPPR